MHTPWGQSQHATMYAPGIVFHETASHGGFKLRPDVNALIPKVFRVASFNEQGMAGWYEEDCDGSLVVYFFPRFFPEHVVERAEKMVKCQYPEAWEQWQQEVNNV